MAFVRATVKLVLRERNFYQYRSPALCLGVPEVYTTFQELDHWSREVSGRPAAITVNDARVTTHPTGQRLKWVDARTFFSALGLDEVVTLDIPGAEHAPGIVHDLNEPLPAAMAGRFGLVMDPGTTEHVFDVKTCFTNIVRALSVGGTVIHQVPIYMYNGGYYSINPNVVHDFYAANGFADVRSFILMWDRYHPYSGPTRVYPYDEDLMGPRDALAEPDPIRYSPLLVTFARKVEERNRIVSPLQYEGHYHSRGAPTIARSHWLTEAARSASQAIEHSRWEALRSLKARVRRRVRLARLRRRSVWM